MTDASLISTIRVGQVGNVGTTQTTLLSYMLKPGVIRNIGDSIRITAMVVYAANTNSKTTIVTFGSSTSVAGRGPSADNNANHIMSIFITRTGESTYRSVGQFNYGVSGIVQILNRDEISGINFNAPIEAKLLGTGVEDNDVVSRFMKLEYLPDKSNFDL
jgi:hypothetical protein